MPGTGLMRGISRNEFEGTRQGRGAGREDRGSDDRGKGGTPLLDGVELWWGRTLFALCRRHGLSFGVIALRIGRPKRSLRGELPSSSEVCSRLHTRIGPVLRETDQLARIDADRHALVFCSDTSQAGASALADRLRAAADDIPLRIGVACFREDALTLPNLVELALERLGDEARPDEGDEPAKGRPPLGRGLSESLGLPLSVKPRSASRQRFSRALKRAFDLTFVAATAPFWLTSLTLIALSVKISNPRWPVFFVQPRTGLGGRRFGMLKFRTMVPDAEERKADLLHLNQLSWPDFKVERDPRVTRIGRILRKTSLDELPQIWNVIRGEMSLVGPRPTSFHPDTYESWHTVRLDVPPGLTGLWQVEARSSIEFDERLRLDVQYIRNQGFFYDLGILMRTVVAVLRARGSR
jgi:lipopolysaccharide/colanic/teichoic acid biosynthesis glycosyltransferase